MGQIETDNGFTDKQIAECFTELGKAAQDLSEAHTALARTSLTPEQYNPISLVMADLTLKINKFHRVMSFLSDGVDVCHEMYIEAMDNVKTLESIIELKETERKEWADTCIKKQTKIENLSEVLRRFCDAPTLVIESPEILLNFNKAPISSETLAWAEEVIKKYESQSN